MRSGYRTLLLRATNLVLFLAFCALAGTGALLTWKLVPGHAGGRGLTALGWDRHQWGDLHFWCGVAAVAATALHLWLNRKWLQHVAAKARSWRLWLGLAAGAALFFGPLCLPVEDDGADRGPGGGDGRGGWRALPPDQASQSASSPSE